MSKGRTGTILVLALAGGAGYYLYTAGGDPKVAQKNLEADASKAAAKLKTDVPGKAKEAEKTGEAYAAQAGQKFDAAVGVAKSKVADAQAKADELRKDTAKQLNTAIDKLDKTVEKKASEAKSGISSWFGGK